MIISNFKPLGIKGDISAISTVIWNLEFATMESAKDRFCQNFEQTFKTCMYCKGIPKLSIKRQHQHQRHHQQQIGFHWNAL